MAHAKAHGSTDQLFQPYFMGKKDYKLFMMYKQFATQDMYNTWHGLRRAVKDKSFDKVSGAVVTTFISGAGNVTGKVYKFGKWTFAVGGILYMFNSLTNAGIDPEDMDDEEGGHWFVKKLFATLERSEFGGIARDIWTLAQGELPYGAGVTTGMQQIAEFGALFLEGGKVLIKDIGDPVSMYKSGGFGRFLIQRTPLGETVEETIGNMFATFRRISSPYEKYAIPYIDVTKTIRVYEDSFRKYHGDVTSGEFPSGIKTVHLKDMEITFKRIRVDEKGNVKDASTITDFMDAIVSTYNTSYEMHIRLHAKKIDEHGVSKDAREFALQTITAKLKSLHPILNGNGIYQDEKKLDEARGRDAFYLTPREKFYEFMRQKAINQHNPENTYTDVMVKGEKMYNARIDAVLLNWDIYLKENIKSDDYKHLLTLKPMIIDKIGDKYKLAFNKM